MQHKIILIMAIFLLMINLLIGVIYATDAEVLNQDLENNTQEMAIESEVQVQNTNQEIENSPEENQENNSRQYYLLGCMIFFVIILVIVEKSHSIKIFIRLILTALILYFAYIKAIVNNRNIAIFTILVTFLIATINIFIKDRYT